MSLLKDVVKDIALNGKLDINKFGLFQGKYGNWLYYAPYNEALTTIKIYPSKDICFFSGNGFNIKEIESLLGKYIINYNWRDDFTRFTFKDIQTKYVESIYFEKEKNIKYDETNNQFISTDVYGKQTIIPYNKLIFDDFTIRLNNE